MKNIWNFSIKIALNILIKEYFLKRIRNYWLQYPSVFFRLKLGYNYDNGGACYPNAYHVLLSGKRIGTLFREPYLYRIYDLCNGQFQETCVIEVLDGAMQSISLTETGRAEPDPTKTARKKMQLSKATILIRLWEFV
ncbi:MAG: hypothetical protein R3B45_16825 [Bdellovibrionota bacterium]